MTKLKVALLTREYPPEVYGGAGVHVTYLARELAPLVDLTVHCQGADRPDAVAHRPWDLLADANQALQVVSTDLSMTAGVFHADQARAHHRGQRERNQQADQDRDGRGDAELIKKAA